MGDALLVFADGSDVLMQRHHSSVATEYASIVGKRSPVANADPLLFSAENTCNPMALNYGYFCIPQFILSDGCENGYINTGAYMGGLGHIRAMLHRITHAIPHVVDDDQGMVHFDYAEIG